MWVSTSEYLWCRVSRYSYSILMLEWARASNQDFYKTCWSEYKFSLVWDIIRIAKEKGCLESCCCHCDAERVSSGNVLELDAIGLTNFVNFSFLTCDRIFFYLYTEPVRIILYSSCSSLVIKVDPQWQCFVLLINNSTSRLAVARFQQQWDDIQ